MKGNVSLGFTTLENELDCMRLPVEGQVPEWLTGTLIRNGAAMYEVGREQYNHWFDGLAMLHRFYFNKGQVYYSNRFLRGRTYERAMVKGRIVYPEFATMPDCSWLGKVYLQLTQQFTDNASVNVTKVADKFLALTETPIRLEFDPDTLNTLGWFNYHDEISGHLTTVHPHFDYERQQIYNYITRFSLKSSYNIYKINFGSTQRKLIASVPVMQPAYMHSFAMTENYIILTEFPLFISPLKLLFSGKPFGDNLCWKPEQGTNFLIVNKDNGKVIGRFNSEPFFAFHHINAFENEDGIFVDLVAYPDASIIKALYLKNIKQGNYPVPTAELRRYRIFLYKKHVDYSLLSYNFAEFPRINYKLFNSRNYNFIYGISDHHHSNGFTNKLIKFNLADSSCPCWYEDYQFPGEPVFVMAPNASGEDEGLILSIVLDTQRGNSYLLILDATSFTELARVQIPHPIPFGSHGQYLD